MTLDVQLPCGVCAEESDTVFASEHRVLLRAVQRVTALDLQAVALPVGADGEELAEADSLIAEEDGGTRVVQTAEDDHATVARPECAGIVGELELIHVDSFPPCGWIGDVEDVVEGYSKNYCHYTLNYLICQFFVTRESRNLQTRKPFCHPRSEVSLWRDVPDRGSRLFFLF